VSHERLPLKASHLGWVNLRDDSNWIVVNEHTCAYCLVLHRGRRSTTYVRVAIARCSKLVDGIRAHVLII
jgi:hypothetical protein